MGRRGKYIFAVLLRLAHLASKRWALPIFDTLQGLHLSKLMHELRELFIGYATNLLLVRQSCQTLLGESLILQHGLIDYLSLLMLVQLHLLSHLHLVLVSHYLLVDHLAGATEIGCCIAHITRGRPIHHIVEMHIALRITNLLAQVDATLINRLLLL